jgi:hypothetical protein
MRVFTEASWVNSNGWGVAMGIALAATFGCSLITTVAYLVAVTT